MRGVTPPEFAIVTPKGMKAPDVVWISADRRQELKKMGDPTTLAPELCIEVMSNANDWDEMMEKRALYREAGAEEVWIVTREGRVRFFGDEEREASRIAPGVPNEI